MYISKKITLYITCSLLIILLASCQSIPPVKEAHTYLEFNEAIRQLSNDLMTKLPQSFSRDVATIILNPFIDIDSGQILQVSRDIERRFSDEIRKYFKQFNISRIALANLSNAQYVLNGFIKYEASKTHNKKKYYQISASIVDLTTRIIVAKATVLTVSEKLNYQPIPSYEDNPLYNFKSATLKLILDIYKGKIGTKISENYYKFITTKALLVDAQTAYDKNNYQQAHNFYTQALQMPSGKIMETYGGLYMTNFKLGNLKEAAKNFYNMIRISVQNGSFPVKLLFQTDSTDFLEVKELRQQYMLWLKQISLYMKTHPSLCIDIIGHTSKYGLDQFNQRLSERRANMIQQKMRKYFPKITKTSTTTGMGSQQTIVGTVPDNIDNAIDRRVEFRIVKCSST